MGRCITPSRRLTSRIEAPEDVWVLWWCDRREVVSCVRNISVRGMFIDTPIAMFVGAVTKISLLVPEGPIKADAVVRHAKPGRGVGLKFTAVREDDRPKLAVLITRLRSLSRSRG